jgi:hypothetical protein
LEVTQTAYPEIYVSLTDGADPVFFSFISNTLPKVCFDEFGSGDKILFKLMKSHGADHALGYLQSVVDDLKNEGYTGAHVQFAEHAWLFSFGQYFLSKMSIDDRRIFFPVNDFHVHYCNDKIVLRLRSMQKHGEGRSTVYFSQFLPAIALNGTKYRVAFPKHILDRISKRRNPRWLNSYAALGDVFSWLNSTTHFEIVSLRDGNPAVTFYDICSDPDFATYQYTKAILGKDGPSIHNDKLYYRFGYCPLVLKDGFAICKTFLLLGYRDTPESLLIEKSDLPNDQKVKLLNIAQREPNADASLTDDDFLPLKYAHDNGIPQLIVSSKKMSQRFYNNTPAIWKPC